VCKCIGVKSEVMLVMEMGIIATVSVTV
jgi:hypothetical protein